MKREYGEDDPIGAETVAAPATVNGEQSPTRHWFATTDKADGAKTREPGDLPAQSAA